MGYSEVRELVNIICRKLDKLDIEYKIHHSCKSSSMYVKIGKRLTIRVSDHYSRTDHYCKYNIGHHINMFSKRRNSYYYRYNRVDNLIKKVTKEIKDKKGRV